MQFCFAVVEVLIIIVATVYGYLIRMWNRLKAAITAGDFERYKRRLERRAKKHLCYGIIAQIEQDVYGHYWTHPRTGNVAEIPTKEFVPHRLSCGLTRHCNRHWNDFDIFY